MIIRPVTFGLVGILLLGAVGCKKEEFKPVVAAPAAAPTGSGQKIQAPPSGAAAPKVQGGDNPGKTNLEPEQGWVREESASNMRIAQFKLPRADGDTEDASFVIYYFGEGGGGDPQANIERWKGQMSNPGGGAAESKSYTLPSKQGEIMVLEATGTYAGGMMPGGGTSPTKENWTMIGAIVPTGEGNYFPKLTGPKKTVEKWKPSVETFLKKMNG